MALSGSFNTNVATYSGHSGYPDYAKFQWSATQDTTANTSTVTYSFTTQGASTDSRWVYVRSRSLTVTSNGTTVLSQSASAKKTCYNNTVLFSGSFVVPHNNDGTASFTVSAELAMYSSSVNSRGSATFTLDTIARASIPTVSPSPFTLGDTITILTNRKSANFTHKIYINYGDESYLIGSDVVDNITFTTTIIANQIYALIPDAKSYTGTISCETYNGSLLIGTATCQYTANASVSPPSYNASYQDTNASTVAITGNDQYIIQNNSTLQVNLTNIIPYNGASIASAKCVINGVEYTGTLSGSTAVFNVGTINVANDITATITLTDSRGFAGTRNLNILVYGWSLPTAIITLERQNNFYSESFITVDADYASLGEHNTITIKFRCKKTSDSNWGSYTNLSDNVQTTFTADNAYEWNVQVLVSDSLGSTTYNLTLQEGIPIVFFDRMRSSTGFNCFPVGQRTVEIDGEDVMSKFTGIGGVAKQVSGDWDTACQTLSGLYMGNNMSNAPSSSAWYFVLHIVHNDKYQRQLAFDFFSLSIYTRRMDNGSWGSWEQVH